MIILPKATKSPMEKWKLKKIRKPRTSEYGPKWLLWVWRARTRRAFMSTVRECISCHYGEWYDVIKEVYSQIMMFYLCYHLFLQTQVGLNMFSSCSHFSAFWFPPRFAAMLMWPSGTLKIISVLIMIYFNSRKEQFSSFLSIVFEHYRSAIKMLRNN